MARTKKNTESPADDTMYSEQDYEGQMQDTPLYGAEGSDSSDEKNVDDFAEDDDGDTYADLFGDESDGYGSGDEEDDAMEATEDMTDEAADDLNASFDDITGYTDSNDDDGDTDDEPDINALLSDYPADDEQGNIADDEKTPDAPAEGVPTEYVPAEDEVQENIPPAPRRRQRKTEVSKTEPDENATSPASATRTRTPRRRQAPVLTIESGAEIETQADREDTAWHEIQNAHRTRKILTGVLGGVERTETGKTIAVVYYKEFRAVIPMNEMVISIPASTNADPAELLQRQNKILSSMLGAEIDFVPKGIDGKTRSIVASRKDAMQKKRQIFYMNPDANGTPMIHEGRIAQARVIAVADKVVRVEVFGVECAILARDLSWDWVGDAHDYFAVGEQILVRVQSVKIESIDKISITADVRSVQTDTSRANLAKCRIQGKYAGKVTDVRKGVVYIRLSIGVNAVAHSCYDNRMPGKKDDISFVATNIDEDRNLAVGIITRIIRQNI